jgi:hypothetical protein
MVINDAALGGETLPAGSVTTEEMDHTPSLKVGRSQLLTEGDTTYVHETVVPSAFVAVTVTEFPSGTVPADIDGVVSDVRLSVDEAPVSDATINLGTPGVEGVVASIDIDNAALAGDTLPAGSVTTEEMDHTPSLKVGRSQLLTEGDTTYVHDTVVPSAFVAVTVTEFPSGTVPADIDGVVSDVRLSVDEAPVSEASSKSGTPGVEADVAIVNGKAVVLPVFPERSVIVALTDHSPSVRTPNVHVEATPTV